MLIGGLYKKKGLKNRRLTESVKMCHEAESQAFCCVASSYVTAGSQTPGNIHRRITRLQGTVFDHQPVTCHQHNTRGNVGGGPASQQFTLRPRAQET
jgi:hypothetical protein